MISVREENGYFGIKYCIKIDDKVIREVNVVRIKRCIEGVHYIFLVDSQGKVIDEVFEYLNIERKDDLVGNRNQAASALKILYSFIDILSKDIRNLDKRDIAQLSTFIRGGTFISDSMGLQLETDRSISTHNIYMDIYRNFFKLMNIECECLFEQIIVSTIESGYGTDDNINKVNVSKYKTNETRDSNIYKRVPKYITLEQYRKIINILDNKKNKYSIRDKIIIMLMYTRGLRIGECLGITIEDIQEHPDDSSCGLLYLRNRLTDKVYQNAKGCMKVINSNTYNLKDYMKENKGYQVISLPSEIMSLIKEYINESRDIFNLSEIAINNMNNYAKADSVYGKENYYLFLSKNYMPLSQAGWNKIMKELFRECNIMLDSGKKENNLNHRFRHGYAMFLVKKLNVEILELQQELRHRSLASTRIYYNPTDDEILEKSKIIQKATMDNFKESIKD